MGEQDTAQCWPDTLVFWEISAICFHKVRGLFLISKAVETATLPSI